jgi:hypothetical protein
MDALCVTFRDLKGVFNASGWPASPSAQSSQDTPGGKGWAPEGSFGGAQIECPMAETNRLAESISSQPLLTASRILGIVSDSTHPA